MLRRIVGLVLIVVIATLAWWLRPPAPVAAESRAAAANYEEARSRAAALLSRDALALHEGCATMLALAGHRTPRAFVLLHGITNCPLQFAELADSLRAGGDNVIVPRVPHHGLADRMTTDLANLRAEEMVALVSECTAIARGLGDTVVVCGLSTSGVAAAWAAVQDPNVDRVVVIAPAFAPPWKPRGLAPVVTRLSLHLPNRFVWWDDTKREALPGPAQCYPRFSTRAMGEIYRLGEATRASLAKGALRAREVDLVTTASDRAIDLGLAYGFAERCRARGAHVRTFEFPARDSVVHDMVDPAQVGAKTALTEPVILAMLRARSLSP